MARYRKKPVEIEAIYYYKDNIDDVLNWIEDFGLDNSDVLQFNNNLNEFEVKTLEGNHLLQTGDYLIRGVEGEFYPVKPEIFNKTYERVGDADG